MNYTKKVRQYCDANIESLIDVSKIKNLEFAEIPYKTLLKILNRLENEGIVQLVSKGLYRIGNKALNDKTILKAYTANGKGMVVGYTLFNNIGLTAYTDDIIEIYTNGITSKQKTIGKFSLKRVDLEFTDEIINLISLLEILDFGFRIQGADYLVYRITIELLAITYNDANFRDVTKAIRFKFSTIVKLNELLGRLNIKNSCIEIYSNA